MHLKLPFTYRVVGRKGNTRRIGQYADYVELDVPETISELAPLAASWEIAGPRGVYRTDCRVFDGCHYTPLYAGSADPDPRSSDSELKVGMIVKGRFTCSRECVKALANRMGLEGGDELSNFEDICLGEQPSHGRFKIEINTVVTSDEFYRRSRARNLISSFLFIDGLLWVRCNEPKLRLQANKLGSKSSISMDTDFDRDLYRKNYGHHSLSPSFNLDMFFNLGDFELAKGAAGEIGGGLERQVTSVIGVSLHRPDLCTFDGDQGTLKTIARELMFKLHGEVGHMAGDMVHDWLYLRDGAANPNIFGVEDMQGALDRLMSAYPDAEWMPQMRKSLEQSRAVSGFEFTEKSRAAVVQVPK